MTDYGTYSDQEILAKLRVGDHGAFNELHHRHYAVLVRHAYNMVGDKDASADLVQDVFVWFWEHREQHQMQSIRGYLITAVKYQASKYLRRGKVREAHIQHLGSVEQHTLNEESLEVKELEAIISSFVHQLPEKCAVIFRMSREEHLSNKAIALQLGISETTVAVQIKRALDKLRTNLGKAHFWMYFFV